MQKTVINELRIGSRVYKVEWANFDELQLILERAGYDDDEEVASGATLHRELKIVICDDLKEFPQRAFETLWHERTHIVEDMCGRAAEDDGGFGERIIDSMANINASLDIQSGLISLDNLVIGNWDFASRKEYDKRAR